MSTANERLFCKWASEATLLTCGVVSGHIKGGWPGFLPENSSITSSERAHIHVVFKVLRGKAQQHMTEWRLLSFTLLQVKWWLLVVFFYLSCTCKKLGPSPCVIFTLHFTSAVDRSLSGPLHQWCGFSPLWVHNIASLDFSNIDCFGLWVAFTTCAIASDLCTANLEG